jgi:FKBP-type peptidyl-prolyl cis-trans isomerase
LIVTIALVGCDSSTPEFYYTQNNLKYKYHDISDNGVAPAIGDYLTVYMSYSNADDSVFYDSKNSTYDGKELIVLGKPHIEGGIEEGFAQLLLGDSVTFYIEVTKFFEHYLKKDLPAFLDAEEEMRISLRLLKIESPTAYKKRITLEQLENEAKEFEVIEGIIAEWKLAADSIYNNNSVFMVYEDTTCSNRVVYGDLVKVKYKGYFPDGKVFYDNTQGESFDEYNAGVKDQNIEGMKIALLHMCKGQKAKILVPSYLGFNESVIEQGLVPRYTPVIFEVEILE